MDRLPPIEGLVENWARARIQCGRPEGRPHEFNAAIGLFLAALQPGMQPEQRSKWMRQAAQLCPGLEAEVAQIAWALPQGAIRLAFRHAFQANDPGKPQPRGATRVPSLPFGAQTPPILMALAYGNVAAVDDAINWHGDPPAIAPTHETEKFRSSPAKLMQPASWLAWALSFRQWDLAEHLFGVPSMRTSESLDRALLEAAGTLVSPVGPQTNPMRNVNASRSCMWINKLVAAGANWHRQHAATAAHDKYQWALGSMKGLDQCAIENDGWTINTGETYSAYTMYARRKRPPGEQYMAPSPAQWLMSEHGPIGWPRKDPGSQPTEENALTDQSIQAALGDVQSLAGLWEDATSSQWRASLSAMMASHATSVYSTAGWSSRPWCPSFMLEGFTRLDPNDAFAPHLDPANPECLWLDALGLHVSAASLKAPNVRDFYGKAVQSMSVCLRGNTKAFTCGLQRTMVLRGTSPRPKFSSSGAHGQIDEYLSIPGIRDLLASLPPAFQQSFASFAARDRDLLAQWLAKADPGTTSMDVEQVEQALRASQALALHRGTLSALGDLPPAPRPMSRM